LFLNQKAQFDLKRLKDFEVSIKKGMKKDLITVIKVYSGLKKKK
jgi:hypothetical protein